MKKKTIKPKLDKETGEYYIVLDDFSEYFGERLKDIKYYEMENVHDRDNIALIINFFDENEEPVPAKGG
jgi:hypothetical protein